MAQVELIMPKMGESVAEATIIKWLKEEGDTIDMEESVLEIATDKVDSEVPSPTEGVLLKKLFGEDDVVKVGDPIAIIETEGGASENGAAPAAETKTEAPKSEPAVAEVQQMVTAAQEQTEDIPRNSNGRFYSPLVRNIAKEEGVAVSELDSIEGSGAEGRVTKKDVLSYIENRGSGAPASAPAPSAAPAAKPAAQPQAAAKPAPQAAPVSIGADDEIIEMDRMRKKIADHMVMSKSTSPHVTSFVEADVTNIWNWRKKVKGEFMKREGENITFTPIFIEAIVKAIKDFPMINVSVDGNNIIKKKHINIGMAAALPSGNLIVPVIHDADQLNLVGLTKKVNDLANRARNNALKPDDIQGGTYTVTNVGTFGNVLGTPIINQPQVAIMATGSINKKPAVIETPEGDFIGIRYKMFLSHSYDHRVVDGALGGMFVKRVADYLEAFDPNRDF
ncbi:dihydrolipoamide acetyltransferase family protein [Owenweeksia hongkongensis]|uniref:Dihydrolipoamide acetyltransferase component of pyruvate dehydrogenase complex n=1 Tax=Owenweeksia hongkongensis (strain DSM 17368 / CIP 108786 / JCM 12287 / NRRL B-23963 / UST20020801) TaxID=926562 RepID=G8R3X4_OWEHD|nr:dihydrolipoamide acetyltransferase family protein [Owenweeksia hongkongensis]AEV32006.1 pyruvate/2-oxoglutarate dehydrogenase complex, dihydrolipoamide acyltransferase component [Owenweeksia hongkongensis DSM 17368]